MKKIEFTVVGKALPAGSKTSFPVLDGAGNPVRAKTGRIITRAKHANPKTADWMHQIGQRAREVYSGELLIGPLRLTLMFVRVRPQNHFGTGKNAGLLKASAPLYPTTRPDVEKLARAVSDALSKVIWIDDSQVVEEHLHKIWGDFCHVKITVQTLGEQQRLAD